MKLWNNYIVSLFVFLNIIILATSDKERITDYELADELCMRKGPERSTIEPPYTCVCKNGHTRHDGICMPNHQIPKDGDVNGDIERIRQAVLSDDAYRQQNFKVLPLKDDRTGSNLRLAAREDDVVQIDQSASDLQTGNSQIDNTNNEPQAQPISLKQSDDGDVAKKEEPPEEWDNENFIFFFAVVAACSIAGMIGLVVAGVCWYRLQRSVKASAEAEYPAYGVTGPTRDKLGSPGDRKLAQSAQMYHYQHQKQQMLAMEKAHGDMNGQGSDVDSEEENEEGDYTVYECPGLAPTGEMEVKNPLFSEDTPTVTPGVTPGNGHGEGHLP